MKYSLTRTDSDTVSRVEDTESDTNTDVHGDVSRWERLSESKKGRLDPSVGRMGVK